ncbi:MAG TPA: polysaccharide biosynthesis tyrosine autokinase [Zeimonas sp.]|nr:polysaccharide biosynthesis tyrosine autokinase [Zeimonas sp.]
MTSAARSSRSSRSSGGTSSSSSQQPSRSSPAFDDDDTISIADILENLSDHRWLFAAVTVLCTLAAGAYALIATPVYTVDSLIQVEDKKGSTLGALSAVAQALDVSSSPVEGEIEILRSRANVTRAVEALRLQTEAEVENRLPVIGGWLARRLERDDAGLAIAPELPMIDPANWAWGGERLLLAEFDVPPEQLGNEHTLVVGDDGAWRLLDPDGELVLQGRAGARSENAGLGYALRVAELAARPGTRFTLRRHSLQSRAEQIRIDLRVSETKRQSGIMRVEYPGTDALAAARLVNAIADAYVQQNAQRRAAEAEKSLQFLEEQLPQLRKQVEGAEGELNSFRNRQQTIDIPGEITGLLSQSVELEKNRLELEMKLKEGAGRYESAHPVMRALREQVASLTTQQKRVNERVRALPQIQQDYLRLARDVEVNTQLYVSLLNNAQQLRVARAGTIANVSIVDRAVAPEKPTKPRRALVLAVGLLGGLAGGFLLTQLLAALRGPVRDPQALETATGVHVSATVPISPEQMTMDRRYRRAHPPFLLAKARPTAGAVEALRTLRLNLQLALADTEGGRTILLTSAVPGQGKSFIAANLAYLMASAGQRVLLIDADIRRSSIGRYLPVHDDRGLSDILRERLDPAPFVRPDVAPNLAVLPAGPGVDNPGDLLTEARLQGVFDWASARFDAIVVDAPPILPVSDAVVLGRFADATGFVVRHKRAAQADVIDAVQQYRLSGAEVTGFVFNCFRPSRIRYGYGARYGYYRGKYGYGGERR